MIKVKIGNESLQCTPMVAMTLENVISGALFVVKGTAQKRLCQALIEQINEQLGKDYGEV